MNELDEGFFDFLKELQDMKAAIARLESGGEL